MEVLLKMASSGSLVKEEIKIVESISLEESCSQEARKENELESAKAKMGEVREENERLKMMLERIEKDYKSLQLRFFDVFQQSPPSNNDNNPCKDQDKGSLSPDSHGEIIMEPDELVSLCLGRTSSISSDHHHSNKKEEKITSINNNSSSKSSAREDDDHDHDSLSLALDSKFQPSLELVSNITMISPENSLEETKEEEAGGGDHQTWPPSKILKRSGDDHPEVSQQNHVKRARVSVRARCDTPTMNDGCQWRKYGQKIAKGNPCPRAYYRCTVAAGCPVRKQVQRCADDMSILITTYEGTHSHPLPVSATAMASTTSAAASMLLSGSSTSQPGLSSTATTSLPNFSLYDNSRSKQFYTPNNSSLLFPTITLDLTNPSSSLAHNFNRFSSGFINASSTPRFPSTSLSFSSPESNILPTLWGNGYNTSFGALPYINNQTQNGSLNILGKQSQLDQFYQPPAAASQQVLTESLTKAITSNPSFRSVIAAAISSMVAGNNTSNGDQGGGGGENFGQNLMMQSVSANPVVNSAQNGKACASSYFNGLLSSSSNNSQTGSNLLQSSPPIPIFKSSPTPTNNNKDHGS
ncbi:hypothetical protein Dsin_007455 [Dipteronia sinensis]|uniref:WRKY domain-containing protein n=1 Tax=Dipteronia sinensis TaxID=43782 RepID=A0AAE0B075_9ROSI|nr:hypothetical protein Dsin_007455 [Dipteronia sinensis]